MANRAQGNTTLTYNSNALTNYVTGLRVTADGKAIDVTTLGSTGKASVNDATEWQVSADLIWDSTLDGYLSPDVITPGTKRDLVVGRSDGTTTVTMTWTSNAEIGNLTLPSEVGDVQKVSVTFNCSGAPGRATS